MKTEVQVVGDNNMENDRFRFRVWDDIHREMSCAESDDVNPFNISDYPQNNIMQCTGLKDKNGKLIYEGDIVRLKAKNGMTFDYAVKYKNYCFILEYINGKLKGTKARNFAKQYAQPKILYEHGYMIIGNIYENPELLEG